MGEVVPSRAFLFIFYFLFLVPSTRPQLTLRSVDFRSVHPKTCFGGGCSFGVGLPRGQIFFFTPKYISAHFSMGRYIKLSFCMGVNRKRPLWIMVAP